MKKYRKNDPKRLAALVKHLNEDAATEADKVSEADFTRAEADNCWKTGDNCGDSWYVLTFEESQKLATERIAEEMWAFNPNHIFKWLDTEEEFTEYQEKRIKDAIEKLNTELCENANPLIKLLVGKNFKRFAEDAIDVDGVQHFISSYNDEEIDLGDGLYAYCD